MTRLCKNCTLMQRGFMFQGNDQGGGVIPDLVLPQGTIHNVAVGEL